MIGYDENDLGNIDADIIDDYDPYLFGTIRERAFGIVDRETMGRISRLEHILDEETVQAVKYVCAHVAGELVKQDTVSKKTAGGAVTYANTDGYMETYATQKNIHASFHLNVRELLRQYLGSDPYGLLYRGL